VPASSDKEAVWLVRLGRGAWTHEAAAGEQRQPAVRELEELGVQYVAGGLAGIQLRWGGKDAGRVLLGEDRGYIRDVGIWLGLVAAQTTAEEISAIEQEYGIKAGVVLEILGSGERVCKKRLGPEVQAFRQKGPRWLRCGVVTTQADWVAEKVVGMGRRKGQWLQAVARGMQVMDAALEQKFRRAVQLWLQWRGVMSSAAPCQEGAYPCSCCRRWWKVVFVLGETGGRDATKEGLVRMAAGARKLQHTRVRPPISNWDDMPVGTRVRVPTSEWMEDPDPEKGGILQGVVIERSTQEQHPEASATTPGTVAVLVEFTKAEARLDKRTTGSGADEVHLVGARDMCSRR